MESDNIPHLNDIMRTKTVIPEKVLTDIQKRKFLFLSVHEPAELIGMLVELKSQARLNDDQLKAVKLLLLSEATVTMNGLTVICCGDTPLNELGEVVREEALSSGIKIPNADWNDDWAMLRIEVRGDFYNRYELLTCDDMDTQFKTIDSPAWSDDAFKELLPEMMYVQNDKEALSQPFRADPVELPPESEAF